MAEKTVREQLATEVLDEIEDYLDRLSNTPHPPKGIYEKRAVLANARALGRAACAVETCTPACDQPTEAHCVECPCFQAGLEAQREPAGRGTA